MFNRQTERKTPTFEKETVKENPLKAFSENSKLKKKLLKLANWLTYSNF